MDWLIRLFESDQSVESRALWSSLVATMRRTDLPYLAVLDPWGNRWQAALLPSSVTAEMSYFANLAARMVDVGDTPAVVTVTT